MTALIYEMQTVILPHQMQAIIDHAECRKMSVYLTYVLSSIQYLSPLNVKCSFPAVNEGFVKGKAVYSSALSGSWKCSVPGC